MRIQQREYEGATQTPHHGTSYRDSADGRETVEEFDKQERALGDFASHPSGQGTAVLRGGNGPIVSDDYNDDRNGFGHIKKGSSINRNDGNDDDSLPAQATTPRRGPIAAPAAAPQPVAGAGAAAGSAADADARGFAAASSGPDFPASNTQFSVEVSYLEIYNEALRDLFNPGMPTAASSGYGSGGVSQGGGASGIAGGSCATNGTGLRLREDPR